MAGVKKKFEKLGFGAVKTYLNSGNVAFLNGKADTERLSKQIGIMIKKQFAIRPRLKNVKTPKRRIFFHHSALIFLAIHKVWLRQIALIGEKISRRWAFRQFSNEA